MKGFIGFTKRNLLIYFKDIHAVIFSLLTSIIVLVLYLLFLKNTFVNGVNNAVSQYASYGIVIDGKDTDMFVNLILLTGIMGSAMITVPYNCLAVVVSDKERKVDYDILATPLKRGTVILSYFVSAALSSVFMTSVILGIGLLILSFQGSLCLGFLDILGVFGTVALGSVSATALFMLVMLFFKSSNACGAFFGVLSAAAGFVIGAYIPLSEFSVGVQTVCNLFPASQVTILLRNQLLGGVLNQINTSLGGVDNGAFVEALKETFSFKANLFGSSLGIAMMYIYVSAGIVLCIFLQVIIYSKSYKKR